MGLYHTQKHPKQGTQKSNQKRTQNHMRMQSGKSKAPQGREPRRMQEGPEIQTLRRTSRQRLNLGRCKQHAHWSASPLGGIERPSRTPLMKTARNASAHTSEVRNGGDPLAEG